MRVAFDATAAPSALTGAGHYMVELVGALARAGVDVDVFARRPHVATVERRAPGAHISVMRCDPRPARLAWEQSMLPLRLTRRRPALLHSPHYTVPLLARVPIVVTFHDATFFTHPRLHERAKVVFFRSAMRLAARRARRVIVDSEATRGQVLSHTAVDPEQVAVVLAGVDHDRFRPPTADEVERFRRRHGIARPWVGFLGTIEPRKNLPRLVAAFSRLAHEWDGDLLLAGRQGWKTDALDDEMARVPGGRVRRLGYLDDDDCRPFLGGAAAVAYPSVAEGFGLPVLEAMACGAPVLTAGVSSTAEVAGDAAVLVDPLSISEIAAGLRSILFDRHLSERLVVAGRDRAAQFTWERTAEDTIAVYTSALA